MSYDLAVFDADVAPRDANAFDRWFGEQTAWDEAHTYDDPGVASPRLRAWLDEMALAFPAMSGNQLVDDARSADYIIGPALIYVAFGWLQAGNACRRAVELAAKHGVGFFDIAGDGEPIWSTDELQRKATELAEAANDEADTEASAGGVTCYRRYSARLRWRLCPSRSASAYGLVRCRRRRIRIQSWGKL
jgi:hypothetical protein